GGGGGGGGGGGPPAARPPGRGLGGGGGGLFLPVAYLGHRAERRTRLFNQQLPDALGIMANCLRSGYSIVQALDVVGREMPPPIGREFDQVTREIRVNIPMEDALANLVRRMASPDLDLAVTAILIQRQVGGNLAEVLDRITYTIRERVRILAEVRTLTAQGRVSGWIIALLPVGLGALLYLFDPDYMRPMLSLPLGWLMLGGAAAMQAVGVLVIARIVKIEV
ncbi:MAG: type II secretion system F family protein, partial [Acetobacteraceae bacterium]|nr:type II secretion system F family protein [Acetobacteraceae bacterium]